MKKVAVTGAGGFIGAYLTKRLASEGYNVVAIDNFLRGSIGRLKNLQDDIEIADVDVRDVEGLCKYIKGCDTVFHLAAVNGTENFYKHPDLVLDVGINGMFSVAQACINSNIDTLIVASTAEVYQTPSIIPTPENIPLVLPNSTNPRYSYGGSKIASELIALNFGRDHFKKVQIFRPHNVYGADMGWKHVIPQLLGKLSSQLTENLEKIDLLIQGDGTETRAFCHVNDIIDGLLLMEQNGSHREIYHIGNDEEVSILELIKCLEEIVGRKINVILGEPAVGGTPRRCPDISKMKTLGYTPSINLKEGLQETARWYLDPSNTKSEIGLL